MDKKIKDAWVKALRSGKYKQGKNYLKNNGCYCCLGVLCHINGKQLVDRDHDRWRELEDKSYDWMRGLGMVNQMSHLYIMNDVYNNSFDEIADYIEENL